MRVIYLHQYFKTPDEGGAIRSYHLAKSMVNYGWEVDMITAHDKPAQTKTIDGIKVHYLSVPYDNSFSRLNRIKAFKTFEKKAFHKMKDIGKADLIYATSTPLSVGSVAIKAKNKLGIPYIFEVRDLWPEAPIQMGVIKNWFLKKYFKALEKRIYVNAEKLVALSPGIKSGIGHVARDKDVLIAPNMSDFAMFSGINKPTNRLKILYNGAIGKANAPDKIIGLIKHNLNSNFDFVIMAQGSELSYLKSALRDFKEVTFEEYGSKEKLKKVYENVDITLTSFKDLPILETCSPNKFFDSLAAGKITLANVNGWLRDMVEQNNCGFYVSDKTDLADLLSDHNLEELKQNACNLAAQFKKEDVCESVIKYIDSPR